MASDPCSICGGDVRTEKRDGNRRLGEATTPKVDVRVCTNSKCRSNTGNRRLGESV